jgi:hypothetical protein
LNYNKFWTTIKKTIKFDVGEVGSDFVAISFNEHWSSLKTSKLDETLEFIVKMLSNRGIKSVISPQGESGYYNLNGKGYILTQSQFKEFKEGIEYGKTAQKISYHSYLNGFLGSWMYSMPVVALWVFSTPYLGNKSLGFAFIVPFSVDFGYDNFNGKIGFWTRWLKPVSTILVVILANIAVTAFNIQQSGVPFTEILAYYKSNAVTQYIFKGNLISSQILGALVWLQTIFSSDNNEDYVVEAQKL